MTRPCDVDGCDRKHYGRGWCEMHYTRWSRYGDPLMTASGRRVEPVYLRRAPIADRFWYHVDRSGVGCWEWQGARNHRGYGSFDWGAAHRAAWEITYGPILNGLFVCHRCDNPPCVRPDHLFLGTHGDNMADKEAKGRGTSGRRATHCRRGHEYTPENTKLRTNGGRRCRTCANDSRRAFYHRKNAG